MAVRIRMKKLGRKHRPFFRICAVDSRAPRDGRVLEELGTYDPMIPETDARADLNHARFSYWLGVGAQMSDKVSVLFRKYGPEGTHVAAREEAMGKRAGPRVLPDQGAPAYVPSEEPTEPETAAAGEAGEVKEADASTETVSPSSDAASEEVVAKTEATEADPTEGEAAESEAAAADEEKAGAENEAGEEEKSE